MGIKEDIQELVNYAEEMRVLLDECESVNSWLNSPYCTLTDEEELNGEVEL